MPYPCRRDRRTLSNNTSAGQLATSSGTCRWSPQDTARALLLRVRPEFGYIWTAAGPLKVDCRVPSWLASKTQQSAKIVKRQSARKSMDYNRGAASAVRTCSTSFNCHNCSGAIWRRADDAVKVRYSGYMKSSVRYVITDFDCKALSDPSMSP